MIGLVIDQAVAVISCARTELILFGVAFAVHFFLFGNVWTQNGKSVENSPARRRPPLGSQEDEREDALDAGAGSADLAQALRHAEAAYERGDHRALLRSWASLSKSDQVPATLLAHVVEAMQRFKKDGNMILTEVRTYLRRRDICDVVYINRLLEPLAKSLDSTVVHGIMESLPELGVKPNAATYELLVQMHFTTRSFDEVLSLARELRTKGIAPTPRTALALLKTALHLGNLKEAVESFGEVVSTTGAETASAAPRHVATQLVELACREHRAELVLPLLEAGTMPFTTEMLNILLAECARTKDKGLAESVERLRSQQGVARSSRTWSLLVRGAGGDAKCVATLLEELASSGDICTPDVAQAVLATCAPTGDVKLADSLFAQLRAQKGADQATQLPAFVALVRFYSEAGQAGKACEVYDAHLKGVRSSTGAVKVAGESRKGMSSLLDTRTEKGLVAAALQCGRQDIATSLLENAPSDTARHIALIRGAALRGKLDEAMQTLQALEQSGAELTHSIWNTALDACVECHDLKRAEALMKRMEAANVADAVSFNTLIKAHLRQENYDRARDLMEEMKKHGCAPNHVTYNELIHALVRHDSPSRRHQLWEVVDEMSRSGVQPNRITCSILLKSLKAKSSHSDIQRTMDLIDSMTEQVDEVLLSSIVEALVRVGKTGLLAQKLAQHHGQDGIRVSGAHTFGSLIKAYGYVRDIAGSWRCWKEMRSQHVRPTSITIGCMVEAVVTNGDVDGGYELLSGLLEDSECSGQVNAVVFGSVLKGYGRARRMERVWAVLREMLSHGIQPSVVTFNAVVDACARNGQMDRVPALMQEMRSYKLEPNLITYSTMIKGYCQRGDVTAAFSTLEELRKTGQLKPDEVVYNTLLDGCAQAGLAAEGERLLTEMQAEGVTPSCYTLTVLVKLMGQVRRVDRAFELVESLTQKHRFRANSHVYGALVQACLAGRDPKRAAAAFERAMREHLQLDQRVCQALIRALLAARDHVRAVSLLRGMLGLNGGAQPQVAAPTERGTGGPALDEAFVREVATALSSASGDAALLAPKLLADFKAAGPLSGSSVTQGYRSAGGAAHRRGRADRERN